MKICKQKHKYDDKLKCCPECRKISNLKWYSQNKEKAINISLNRYNNNKEEINQKRKIARLNRTPEQIRKTYNRKNAYRKKKYKNDPLFALSIKLRIRLKRAVRLKIDKTDILIGCSVSYLRSHLESQFQPGMSWDNYGKNGWEIDHIIPLASFDLSVTDQLKKACHYTNLQPLWAEDNKRKNNKIPYEPT